MIGGHIAYGLTNFGTYLERTVVERQYNKLNLLYNNMKLVANFICQAVIDSKVPRPYNKHYQIFAEVYMAKCSTLQHVYQHLKSVDKTPYGKKGEGRYKHRPTIAVSLV